MSVGEFWPEKGVISNTWTLNHRQSAPSPLSGNSIAVTHGESFWTVDVTVEVPLFSPLVRQWSSFFARREGQKNTFTMNRTFQSFPASPLITTDVGLTILSVSRDLSRVRFGGTNSSLSQTGDMIGYFTANNGFYLGEVKSRVDTITLEVTPPPFPPHPTLANPRRIKALGEFRMDGPPRPTENATERGWRFSATQVIRG